MSPPATEYPLVADSRTLDELLQRVADAELVALDTEFVRERTYFPELCVLQIATGEIVAAVDCLADIDLDALLAVLLADGRPWLLHSARQDLEVLFYRAGRLPERLIDTQIAAALLGHPLQIGLQGLLREVLDIPIDKEHTRADWRRRPLPAAVLDYALDDVRYLLPAWQALAEQLKTQQRRAWFEEDCARQLQLPVQADVATVLERTRGAAALRGERRAAAAALVAWREERARRRDKPRRWILADEPLVRIANALPTDLEALRRIDGLPQRLVAHSGSAILTAIRDAKPVADAPEPVAPDKALVKSLQAEVKARAQRLGLLPELLATRKDIALAAAGGSPESFTSGWRGEILNDLLAGLSRAPAC